MSDLSPARLATGLLWLAAAACACSSSTPKPEEPTSAPTDAPAGDPQPSSAAGGEEPAPSEGAGGPTGKKGDSIPDDYEMTNGDCSVLGKHLGQVQKNDQMSALSPKLKPAQREQAEVNIDKVTAQNAEKWTAGCQESLVGKVVDPKSLKCALGAKTVKEFDGCINPPAETAKP